MHLLKGNLSVECGQSRGDARKLYLVLCVLASTIAARHVKFGTKLYHQLTYTPRVRIYGDAAKHETLELYPINLAYTDSIL